MAVIAPKQYKRLLIIPDTHVPFHSKPAFALLLEVLREVRFDRIVFLGDFLEMYATSRHLRNPDISDCFEAEATVANKCLDAIEKAAKLSGVQEVTYLQGNHEFNLERYILEQAPALRNLVKIDKVLRLKERGWGYKRYGDFHREGKLHLVHDDGKAGNNAHRDALSNYNASVGIGHTHQAAIAYMGDVLDRKHVGAMFGWLGDILAEPFRYAHQRAKQKNWQLAIGTALLAKNGTAHVQVNPMLKAGAGLEVSVFGRVVRL